tara:strand:+ start:367 stop:501 length:135 start_codon:yes stop_codon:yes gene_type:complete
MPMPIVNKFIKRTKTPIILKKTKKQKNSLNKMSVSDKKNKKRSF